MSTLNHEELEREIVRYDKQKLITECLKIFDVNVRLTAELEQSRRVGMGAKNDAIEAIKERRRLERLSLWKIFLERLNIRSEAKRNRQINAIKI